MGLPPELYLHIIEALIPPDRYPVAYSPSDPVTQALRSWSLVRKSTRTFAQRLLLKHCLYIDSRARLEALLHCAPLHHSSPQGLFLAPFRQDDPSHLDIAIQIDTLFRRICPHLTRLVINIPLRYYLYSEDDVLGLRQVLRAAFGRLTALEEFCSMQDDPYLGVANSLVERSVWSFWPRLRRLALYDVDLSRRGFFPDARRCATLTQLLVVVRPHGLVNSMEEKDKRFLRAWNFGSLRRVLLVDTEYPVPEGDMMQTFLGRLMAVQADDNRHKDGISVDIQCLAGGLAIWDEEIDICQSWFSARAISGQLWV